MLPLESSKLFNTLTEAELQRVRLAAQERVFEPDQVIFKEGDPGDGIYVIRDGTVQISAVVGPERRALTSLGPGDLFGEMAVLDSDPRSATATAETRVAVFFIPREDLLQLLECIPRLAASLVREISRRLRDFNRQYIQEVLQAERLSLVGRFARSIVHDLKNPLNVIAIASELGGMEGASPEARASARTRIRKQVDRISNMVNELLEFTRGAHTAFVLAQADYATFVNQLIDEMKPEIAARGVALELENPPPAVKVELNPPRLTRVFHNLIHNATDAMPEGGKVIMRFRVENNSIVTEIEDTGSGIAPEMLDKLFEAFATYGKAHGTGLGLSICKRIIEDHHGKIRARNEPGRGAVFSIALPPPRVQA